jgi:hypothetical protein
MEDHLDERGTPNYVIRLHASNTGNWYSRDALRSAGALPQWQISGLAFRFTGSTSFWRAG